MDDVEAQGRKPRKQLRVIKLGGAAITCKSRMETLDEAALDACVQHIAQVVRQDRAHGGDGEELTRTVVVHGAGSFGHFQASSGGVASGWASAGLTPEEKQRVRQAFVDTRISVTRLNQEVVARLAQAGVPAVGVSPFAGGWATRGRAIPEGANANNNNNDVGAACQHGCEIVESALAAGLVPVLHGDAVLDRQLGCTILSGDTLVRVLARRLRPGLVVFLTNVDGLFDRPPDQAGAIAVKRVDVAPDGSWAARDSSSGATLEMEMSTAEHDTTGGIALKVAEAASIARLGMDVLIAKAGSKHALAALQGLPLEEQQQVQLSGGETTANATRLPGGGGQLGCWLGTHVRPVPDL